MCVYMYVYIERERERERSIYTYMHIHELDCPNCFEDVPCAHKMASILSSWEVSRFLQGGL